MKSFIRNLSAPAEFCLILFVGFGPFIALQLWNCVQSKRVAISNGGVVAFPIVELVLLAAVLWIGKIRGWSLVAFGSRMSWRGTGSGILLFVVAEAAMISVTMEAQIIHPEQSPITVGRLAVLPVLLISIINPVFEEVLGTGYFIHSLQRFGMWPAILASAVFRGGYHLQFGVNAALGVFAFGVIFGFAYWRWRQLWPLIVAHLLADLFALFYGSYHAA
jgi:uncharacterized protein